MDRSQEVIKIFEPFLYCKNVVQSHRILDKWSGTTYKGVDSEKEFSSSITMDLNFQQKAKKNSIYQPVSLISISRSVG